MSPLSGPFDLSVLDGGNPTASLERQAYIPTSETTRCEDSKPAGNAGRISTHHSIEGAMQ